MIEEKRKKGRPARDTSNEYKVTINDPLLDPYYIEKDSLQFTLLKKHSPTRGYQGGDISTKENIQIIGYYTHLGNALKKVMSLKINTPKKYSSLKEYVDNWETIRKETEQIINNLNTNYEPKTNV
jgi:hypothetical protein